MDAHMSNLTEEPLVRQRAQLHAEAQARRALEPQTEGETPRIQLVLPGDPQVEALLTSERPTPDAFKAHGGASDIEGLRHHQPRPRVAHADAPGALRGTARHPMQREGRLIRKEAVKAAVGHFDAEVEWVSGHACDARAAEAETEGAFDANSALSVRLVERDAGAAVGAPLSAELAPPAPGPRPLGGQQRRLGSLLQSPGERFGGAAGSQRAGQRPWADPTTGGEREPDLVPFCAAANLDDQVSEECRAQRRAGSRADAERTTTNPETDIDGVDVNLLIAQSHAPSARIGTNADALGLAKLPKQQQSEGEKPGLEWTGAHPLRYQGDGFVGGCGWYHPGVTPASLQRCTVGSDGG